MRLALCAPALAAADTIAGISESVIPGMPKIRLRAITNQPGASSKSTMKNSMICEIAESALDGAVVGKPVRRKTGDIYTCRPGLKVENKNNGTTVAVMRIFDLRPAWLITAEYSHRPSFSGVCF